MKPQEIIEALELAPHPEGGFYRETYRSAETIPLRSLGGRAGAARAHSTAIHYLLTEESFSALHRIDCDEIFHFYLGSPVTMLLLHGDGAGETLILGRHDKWQTQIQAQIQRKANVHVYAGGLSDEALRDAMVIPCHSIEQTLQQLLHNKPDATIAILPEGPQTVPYVS